MFVCVDGGGGVGREGVCLQDFELMQSRQGFRVDEWQVIPRKSSAVRERVKFIFWKFLKCLKAKGDISAQNEHTATKYVYFISE